VGEIATGGGPHASRATFTALEVALLYAGILTFIWRWQFAWPRAWMLLWAVILVSHLLHHDTLRGLGLVWTELRASAQVVLPLALVLYLPMVLYGFAHHSLVLLPPHWHILGSLLGYGSWCLCQQYLTQSYFHNRLTLIIRSRHVRSVLVGIMFSAAHLPNLPLMIATLIAGFIFAEVFARHRNIWPLALAQALGGLLLAAIAPDALIHHMRVGPGYFLYGIR